MPNVLRNLKIDRVASVDKGAGDGVQVVFWKRDGAAEGYLNSLTKRDFTQAERDEAERKGNAMPGGGYPINNVSDLENAIRAIGRAKDPAKTKAHIKARARALGATDKIPESWGKRAAAASEPVVRSAVEKVIHKNLYGVEIPAALANPVFVGSPPAIDFDDVLADQELSDDARDLLCCVREAVCALDCSLCSILGDDAVTDKPAMLQESFDQFRQYLADLGLEDVGKLLATAKGADTMTTGNAGATAIQKQIADEIAKALAPHQAQVAALKRENAVLKMSEKHKDYHDKLDGEAKDKFADMSPGERDDHMEKNPIKKGLEAQVSDMLAKALDPVMKQLQPLVDTVAGITKADRLSKAQQHCKSLGLPPSHAEVYLKAQGGDADALAKHEEELGKVLKAAHEQARSGVEFGGLFTEIGKSGSGSPTAYDELVAKAQALQSEVSKQAGAKPLSPAQAFAKVYDDPANRELVKRHKDEEARRRMRAA